jgi:hypothetical protein
MKWLEVNIGIYHGGQGQCIFPKACEVIRRNVNEARKSEAEAWSLKARSWGYIPIIRLKSQNIKLLCNVHVMNDN